MLYIQFCLESKQPRMRPPNLNRTSSGSQGSRVVRRSHPNRDARASSNHVRAERNLLILRSGSREDRHTRMKAWDLNVLNIGTRLTITFLVLLLLILGGNGFLIWQFRLAQRQTDRLSSVNQQ